MSNVLVIRLSSFGDVAMLVPAVYSVAARYPQVKFSVLTRTAFVPLFDNLGFNVNGLPVDMESRHKGIRFYTILSKLRKEKFSHVVDEHDVLRSKIVRLTALIFGWKKVVHIDKGRKEKRFAIRTKQMEPPLKHTVQRYLDTFAKAGFPAEMTFTNFFELANTDFYQLRDVVQEKTGQWIGIAPFSKHPQKNYPVEKMEKVIAKLSENSNYTIFLFGGNKEERKIIREWCNRYPNVKYPPQKLKLIKELLLIYYLDVMVSMDSANMHLASLVQVPVVSIWGATHPNLGFSGFNQFPENAIQTDIECRPCSVYGEIPCARGDLACLYRISEESVVNKIEEIISKNLNR